LIALEDLAPAAGRVLDAGCGSGILSIAAARLGARRVDAFDIDPIAVAAAQENIRLNDLTMPIAVVVSSGPDRGALWQGAGGSRPAWDVILVNILPHVISGLLQAGLHSYLAPAGRMILAGIIAEREAEVRAVLAGHGLTVVRRLIEGDWVGLVAAG
jgi:ribosomal protein L11 methyltransferase